MLGSCVAMSRNGCIRWNRYYCSYAKALHFVATLATHTLNWSFHISHYSPITQSSFTSQSSFTVNSQSWASVSLHLEQCNTSYPTLSFYCSTHTHPLGMPVYRVQSLMRNKRTVPSWHAAVKKKCNTGTASHRIQQCRNMLVLKITAHMARTKALSHVLKPRGDTFVSAYALSGAVTNGQACNEGLHIKSDSLKSLNVRRSLAH